MNDLPANYASLSTATRARIADEERLPWDAKEIVMAARGGYLYLVPPELISSEIANAAVGPMRRTIFHYAACRGNLGCIPEELFTSAAMNRLDAAGMTPIDYALDYEAVFGPRRWAPAPARPVYVEAKVGAKDDETAAEIEQLILAACDRSSLVSTQQRPIALQ